LIGVINASPLIYLGKLGAVSLLTQLFQEIWTSQEVRHEVLSSETSPERPLLQEAFSTWLKIYHIEDQAFLTRILDLQIHRGEASVIAIAKELKDLKQETIVIIDDLTAREIARTLSLPIIGTIGVLLRSVKKELLTPKDFKQKLDILIEETDFRMSIKLYSQLLKEFEKIVGGEGNST
jgi:predicted nucleic acid-binding protein